MQHVAGRHDRVLRGGRSGGDGGSLQSTECTCGPESHLHAHDSSAQSHPVPLHRPQRSHTQPLAQAAEPCQSHPCSAIRVGSSAGRGAHLHVKLCAAGGRDGARVGRLAARLGIEGGGLQHQAHGAALGSLGAALLEAVLAAGECGGMGGWGWRGEMGPGWVGGYMWVGKGHHQSGPGAASLPSGMHARPGSQAGHGT